MNLVTPIEYRDKFVEAEAMFMHQPVFDPIKRCVVPLTPVAPGTPLPLLDKDNLSPSQAYQLALGNLDPFTLQVVENFDPDNPQVGMTYQYIYIKVRMWYNNDLTLF